ncbi:MAG: FAD-dependent oxidoreductase [Alphaproteobacteria bacterium]
MINKNKRSFISESYKWSLLLLLGQISLSTKVKAQYKAKIVIIGAGFGGATCLNYLSNFSNLIDLTIIDKNERIQTCPFSNLVIGDIIKTSQITFSYKKNPNINSLQKKIKFINSEKKKIFFFDNSYLDFDYLILSPGIGYKNKQIEGYSIKNEKMVPHCWDGEKKIKIFKQRLEGLDDKYPILISAPDYPYRCPPAPYERASMIANYMKKMNKNFKILIFDSKNTFTKKEIFFDEWKKIYGDSIEWIARKKRRKN